MTQEPQISDYPHNHRYYHVPPEQKSVELCRQHGRSHAAYGWSKQIDPRWSQDQFLAYLDGYSSEVVPNKVSILQPA